MEWLENSLLAVLGLALLVFWLPHTKETLKRSRTAKADWVGALIPLAMVIGFVFLLIILAKQ